MTHKPCMSQPRARHLNPSNDEITMGDVVAVEAAVYQLVRDAVGS